VKFAFSNIAWPAEQNDAVAKILVAAGATGVEVAPTKLWPRPLEVSDSQIDDCRRAWADRGLMIVAAQALLFGRPELTIFESGEKRRQTREHLAGIIRVCARLGAEALVFGSPKNRSIAACAPSEVHETAVEFFRDLGRLAQDAGTHVVLEAIPRENGADYLLSAAEAIALVRDADQPGFRLHLDTACMSLAGDPIASTFEAGRTLLRHFHVSEPGLAAIGTSGRVNHEVYAKSLAALGYPHWVSIEMRDSDPFTPDALAASLRFVREVYG